MSHDHDTPSYIGGTPDSSPNTFARASVGASRVTELELVRNARAGDAKALSELIERLRDSVYRLSLRMLWHPDDAADATQEILFKVVTGVGTFRGDSSVRTWAMRIATNHLLNVRRSRVEAQSYTFESFARELADGVAEPVEPSAPPRDAADQALLEEEVKIGCTQAMLLCLARDERLAYILGDVFELRSDDAAEVLAVDPATFRKRLSRARARIRAFMTAHCGLIEPAAPCSCARRVRPAIARGRVRPDQLLFAGQSPPAPRRLPVLEAVGAMERLHEIAAVHQSHPRFQAPRRVADAIRPVLESPDIQSLLGE